MRVNGWMKENACKNGRVSDWSDLHEISNDIDLWWYAAICVFRIVHELLWILYDMHKIYLCTCVI